jgi:predicted RNA-binding protein
MPKNYWMFVQTPENFEISRERSFNLHGLRSRQRRRAQRMGPDDRVLFYVSGIRKWTATASITSSYFEDRTPIWKSYGKRLEEFPYRVRLTPAIVLDEEDYIDALLLGPSLEYVKRWAPERWYLAFQDTLHLLPQRDFRLIESEMKKAPSGRRTGRGKMRSGEGGNSERASGASEEVGPEDEGADGDAPYPEAEDSASDSR